MGKLLQLKIIDNVASQSSWDTLVQKATRAFQAGLGPTSECEVALHIFKTVCPAKAPPGLSTMGLDSALEELLASEEVQSCFPKDLMDEYECAKTIMHVGLNLLNSPRHHLDGLRRALKAGTAATQNSSKGPQKKATMLSVFVNSLYGKNALKNAINTMETMAKDDIQEKQVIWGQPLTVNLGWQGHP
eukprot:3746869-Pyramimonas_sp.AAC.1